MPLFPAGRRWFLAGSWATILVAILHTLGNTLSSAPADDAYATLERTMRGYRVPVGLGMMPSVWDINQSLVFTMSICLVALGLLGIAIGTSRDAGPRLLQTSGVVLTLASLSLTGLYYVCQVTPALVSMAVVTLLYAASVFDPGKNVR